MDPPSSLLRDSCISAITLLEDGGTSTTLHQGTLLCGINLNTVEMATNWVLYVRVVQLIFAIIVLGLTAYGIFRPSCIPTHSLYSSAPFLPND